jgi:hypothetical protein
MPIHPIPVDDSAAGGSQILKNMIVADGNDFGMRAGYSRIVDNDMVMSIPADTDAILVEEALVENRPAFAQDQLCHRYAPYLT